MTTSEQHNLRILQQEDARAKGPSNADRTIKTSRRRSSRGNSGTGGGRANQTTHNISLQISSLCRRQTMKMHNMTLLLWFMRAILYRTPLHPQVSKHNNYAINHPASNWVMQPSTKNEVLWDTKSDENFDFFEPIDFAEIKLRFKKVPGGLCLLAMQ